MPGVRDPSFKVEMTRGSRFFSVDLAVGTGLGDSVAVGVGWLGVSCGAVVQPDKVVRAPAAPRTVQESTFRREIDEGLFGTSKCNGFAPEVAVDPCTSPTYQVIVGSVWERLNFAEQIEM
ncbi:hypothetical protein AS038_01200 [Arthrobacter sp. NIO-1057]|nr:hypothetical protein AS038_01200 [Arthrobacter sp. NIO-1057]